MHMFCELFPCGLLENFYPEEGEIVLVRKFGNHQTCLERDREV